jgi:hypothetical protein
MVLSISDREIRYVLVELENGVKIPAAEIGYTIEAIPDPEVGRPLYGAWALFDAALKTTAEGAIVAREGDVKCGVKTLTTLEEIKLPILTTNQMIVVGILAAKEICKDAAWNMWADLWLSGEDRSKKTAKAAARTAKRLDPVARASRSTVRASVRCTQDSTALSPCSTSSENRPSAVHPLPHPPPHPPPQPPRASSEKGASSTSKSRREVVLAKAPDADTARVLSPSNRPSATLKLLPFGKSGVGGRPGTKHWAWPPPSSPAHSSPFSSPLESPAPLSSR